MMTDEVWGMAGRARKTVTVEEIGRGRLMSDLGNTDEGSTAPRTKRKVNRGLLRR